MDGWIIPLIGGSAFCQTHSQVASLKLYRTDGSNVGKPGGDRKMYGGNFFIACSRYVSTVKLDVGEKRTL